MKVRYDCCLWTEPQGPLPVSPQCPLVEPGGNRLQGRAEARFGRLSLILNSCFAVDPIYPYNNPAGCYANGQIRAHGDRWREDDCTFCQCINGEPHCVATACGQSCMHPVKVPGECCPVCEGKPCESNERLATTAPVEEASASVVLFSIFFFSFPSGIMSASCCCRLQTNLLYNPNSSFGESVANLK